MLVRCTRHTVINHTDSVRHSQCEAAIWVNDPAAKTERPSDYLRCWQTSGLGAVKGSGYGQITYKGACSGSCSGSYKNVKKQ